MKCSSKITVNVAGTGRRTTIHCASPHTGRTPVQRKRHYGRSKDGYSMRWDTYMEDKA